MRTFRVSILSIALVLTVLSESPAQTEGPVKTSARVSVVGQGTPDRMIVGEVFIKAPVGRVWEAWTTDAGIKGFFALGTNIELKIGGLYEIFFAPDAPPGQRGADEMRILAIEPDRMLSFTWNAPPSLPNVRRQRTSVVLRFYPEGESTRLRLSHWGWGEGEEWDKAMNYLAAAWPIVLARLEYSLTVGPIDWRNPPRFEPR